MKGTEAISAWAEAFGCFALLYQVQESLANAKVVGMRATAMQFENGFDIEIGTQGYSFCYEFHG